MAQDDLYYEIQLSNKKLVFYFMAGATGLVLSFLAGVMVGRGVDQTASADAQLARPVVEDRIVTEEPPATRPAPPVAEDLSYAQRLEGDSVDDSLEKPAADKPAAGATKAAAEPQPTKAAKAPPATQAAAAPAAAALEKPVSSRPATVTKPAPTPPAKPAPAPATKPAPSAAAGMFTIQVGAFKDRASAESVVDRLKSRGFAAYVVAPEGADGGLFNVRVGSYPARADAERIQAKLRDEEKFKPFIVRN